MYMILIRHVTLGMLTMEEKDREIRFFSTNINMRMKNGELRNVFPDQIYLPEFYSCLLHLKSSQDIEWSMKVPGM